MPEELDPPGWTLWRLAIKFGSIVFLTCNALQVEVCVEVQLGGAPAPCTVVKGVRTNPSTDLCARCWASACRFVRSRALPGR